jgi:hypothetical protein
MEELNEDVKFKISIKTLVGIVAGVASLIGAWYAFDASIDSRIEEKVNSMKPGKGFYQVDPADPAAKETWPPSRQEYQMKDELARQTLEQQEQRIKRLEEKN